MIGDALPPRCLQLEDALRAEPELAEMLIEALAKLIARGANPTVAFMLTYTAVCGDLWSLLGALHFEECRFAEHQDQPLGMIH
jgi:hypothetical protein